MLNEADAMALYYYSTYSKRWTSLVNYVSQKAVWPTI